MDIEELEKLRIKAKKIVLIGGFCSIIFGIFLLIKFLASYVSVIVSGIFNIEVTTSENF